VRQLLGEVLGEAGYETAAVPTGEAALGELDRQSFDAVLLDLNLPGIQGMDVLRVGPTLQTDTPFIVMTAFGSVDTRRGDEAGRLRLRQQAVPHDELLLTLQRAVEETSLRREVAQLRRRVRDGTAGVQMVGRSTQIERVRDLIARVAPSRATVLITGETGTGKELVARLVHALSPRAERPFLGSTAPRSPTRCSRPSCSVT